MMASECGKAPMAFQILRTAATRAEPTASEAHDASFSGSPQGTPSTLLSARARQAERLVGEVSGQDETRGSGRTMKGEDLCTSDGRRFGLGAQPCRRIPLHLDPLDAAN